MSVPSQRLRACIELGGIENLFPTLKDWSAGELQALIDDAEALYDVGLKAIDQVWLEEAFKLSNFMDPKALDEARTAAAFDLFVICSEITSVAYFYLPKDATVTV